MDYNKLESILYNGENDKVDFKKEWYDKTKKIDLVIDIVNFVNTVHHDDCYIIIGIEDITNKVVGIDINDTHRLNTEKITDLIRNLPIANQYIPKIEVTEFVFNDKTLDIITIFNTTDTPVYLTTDYRKNGKTIGAGQIISRNQGTNTPINKTAPSNITEKLWKKRFKMDQNINVQYNELLKDFDNWSFIDVSNGNPARFIYNLNSNFYIEFIEDDMPRENCVALSLNATRLDVNWQIASLKYNHLEIDSFLIYILDGARFYQVCPRTGTVNSSDKTYRRPVGYDYYIYDSLQYNLNRMLWHNPHSINSHYYHEKDSMMSGVVIYKDDSERLQIQEEISKSYILPEEINPSEEDVDLVKSRIQMDLYEYTHEINSAEFYLLNLNLGILINKHMNFNSTD
ncbi:AlbA family DNA-binding domain-containing protein [Alkalibacterium olivapovliticus]|uniref:Putative DNA-binding protein n=1 Tax=Alkalibacterium olivapovliticus TaxID=99907 RepID=A0A2T0W3T7_9LACT|nr:ATP-binding protein [Alkalibacterium olivapovliticus]PRY80128.1 putative DNA-binding protein [Alkalibacterium olivapovliticus]